MHYALGSQPLTTYNKSMNTCLIPTISISFDAVYFSGSNKFHGVLLFSYLTKLCAKNTITQVSHSPFPTEPQANPSISDRFSAKRAVSIPTLMDKG